MKLENDEFEMDRRESGLKDRRYKDTEISGKENEKRPRDKEEEA